MPLVPRHGPQLDALLSIRGVSNSSNSTADALPNTADNSQPTFIHFSTLTLILISCAVFLVLLIVSILVILARRHGKVPKLLISKPERRESSRTVAHDQPKDLKLLRPGLPDPPSFAGRFSYYNASGGEISLKNVIVEDRLEKDRGFPATERDRAWLLDQNAISPVAPSFSPSFPASRDSSFSDVVSMYSQRGRSADPLRGSDMPSYYFKSPKTSSFLPSAPSPVYSPADSTGWFQPARGMRPMSYGFDASASAASLSSYGEPSSGTAKLDVWTRYDRSRHRVSDAPPRLPTLVGLDAFSNIGSAMMLPSPLLAATPVPSSQPALIPPTTPVMDNTPRSRFSPPTPLLSPIQEETQRASNFSFSRFYGSYAPTTPKVGPGAMTRSETAREKFKHRRFSSEVDARFAVGLGLDLSRRAGYI